MRRDEDTGLLSPDAVFSPWHVTNMEMWVTTQVVNNVPYNNGTTWPGFPGEVPRSVKVRHLRVPPYIYGSSSFLISCLVKTDNNSFGFLYICLLKSTSIHPVNDNWIVREMLGLLTKHMPKFSWGWIRDLYELKLTEFPLQVHSKRLKSVVLNQHKWSTNIFGCNTKFY